MTTKKAATKIPPGRPKVKVIQTVDAPVGAVPMLYFTDGTHMPVKADTLDLAVLHQPEFLAPNSVRVWTERSKVVYMEPLDPQGK